MGDPVFSRQRLFEAWNNVGLSLNTINFLFDFVGTTVGAYDKHAVQAFAYRLLEKWKTAGRNKEFFETKFKDWLAKEENFGEKSELSRKQSTGRPEKPFNELCQRSKRRRCTTLRNKSSTEEMAMATAMNLRAEGNASAASLVKDLCGSSSKAAEIIEAVQAPKSVPMTPDKALSVYIDTESTKAKYQVHRNAAIECNSNLYPPYTAIKDAMDRCIPESVDVTEGSAEVKLQCLLDHTTERIVTMQKDVIGHLGDGCHKLLLQSKWGFDGASGQSNYKQKFADTSLNDSAILITSLVPIQLVVDEISDSDIPRPIWFNTKTSSCRTCRPIRIQFIKENKETSVSEEADITRQINALIPTKIRLSDTLSVEVTHSLLCTMIDGKVCSALTGVSSQRCPVCGAYPREFNDLALVSLKEPNTATYDFGISPLHTGIRFMESLLHIAYRTAFKKTNASGGDKDIMAARKKEIQQEFRETLGLLIDVPKQGSGTSNDGNTARKFFREPETTAAILKISNDLVRRFGTIVQTLNTGYFIDVESFRKYGLEAYLLYTAEYPWYRMPPSVHRVLLHGADVIAHCQAKKLTISSLSEEPQESRNKDIRRFRENYSRKCTRLATMTDVFRRLLVTSDPLISSIRRSAKRTSRATLLPGVALLLSDSVASNGTDSETDAE